MRVAWFWVFFSVLLFCSCTDEQEQQYTEPEFVYVTPGEYERSVELNVPYGEPEAFTRALNEQGAFTAEYDAEHLYIHSVKNSSKYMEIPIVNIDGCVECGGNGIRFRVCVHDDQSYTVYAGENSVTFDANEETYFSSQIQESWVGKSVDASPVTGQSVLIRDEKTNGTEIYRSEKLANDKDYLANDLLKLDRSTLTMERKCGAFRMYFMFTDLNHPDSSRFDFNRIEYMTKSSQWEELSGTPLDNWVGKVYIGPFFSDSYNLATETAGWNDGHQHGYYATNQQKYVSLSTVSYTRMEGEIEHSYMGYGVSTASADYLVTPFDDQHEGHLTFYAFLKNSNSDLESDSGSKYVEYSWDTESVPPFNKTIVLVVIYDVQQLGVFMENGVNSVNKRSIWEGPEKLDIQPAKVYCYTE